MHITFFTIVLDGWPWISWHRDLFERAGKELGFTWDWCVAEGTALPLYCSHEMNLVPVRTSYDQTLSYLGRISWEDERVKVHSQRAWNGKIEMVNQAISMGDLRAQFYWQVDVDELWTVEGMRDALAPLQHPTIQEVRVDWDHYVGERLVTGPGKYARRSYWGNVELGWPRIWRRNRKFRHFVSHEPAVYLPNLSFARAGRCDHCGYVLEKQVSAKAEQYRGRHPQDALEGWRRLQALSPEEFPAVASLYLPWVQDDTRVYYSRPHVGVNLLNQSPPPSESFTKNFNLTKQPRQVKT